MEFLACDASIKQKLVARANVSSAVLGGEGLFNLALQGNGIAVLECRCPQEELIEIRDKFGDERKTKIVAAEGELDVEDLIKEEQAVIALTHFGYIKRMPIDTYRSQKRGGKGITGIATREDDFVKEIFTASTHDTILFFSNKGKMYRLRGFEIPEAGRTAKGTAIVNLLNLEAGEKISAIIPLQNFASDKYLLMATRNGLIKKTSLSEYSNIRKTGIQAITLKDDDEIIDVSVNTNTNNSVSLIKRYATKLTKKTYFLHFMFIFF